MCLLTNDNSCTSDIEKLSQEQIEIIPANLAEQPKRNHVYRIDLSAKDGVVCAWFEKTIHIGHKVCGRENARTRPVYVAAADSMLAWPMIHSQNAAMLG